MNGMNAHSAIGPIRKAVIGEAACSTEWANPNTRPSRSGGTTFWKIVCSMASVNGTKNIQMKVPTASSVIEGCTVKKMHTVQVTMLLRKSGRSGSARSEERRV